MSLGHEHGLVLIGLAGPMDVVSVSLSLSPFWYTSWGLLYGGTKYLVLGQNARGALAWP